MRRKKKLEPQPKPWKPSARVRAFLAAYRKTASITRAAKAARIRREAHYRLLERSVSYQAAFESAAIEAGQTLEDEAVRRAVEGIRRPLFYHGKRVKGGAQREYSDTLLLALLKAKKPRDYKERVEHDLAPDARGQVKRFTGSLLELLDLYRTLVGGPKKGDR
jgi:hypothetical protein